MNPESKIKISASGIKRFKDDKIEIEIAPNITTIVGPNGSGKSTILETLGMILSFLGKHRLEGDIIKSSESLKIERSCQPGFKSFSVELPVTADSLRLISKEFRATAFGTEDDDEISQILENISFVKITYVKSPYYKDHFLICSIEFISQETDNPYEMELDYQNFYYVDFDKLEGEETRIKNEIAQSQSIILQIKNFESQLKASPNNASYLQKKSKLEQDLKKYEDQESLKHKLGCLQKQGIGVSGDFVVSIKTLDDFIASLNVPECIFLNSQSQITDKIEDFTREFKNLRNKPHAENSDSDYSQYREMLSDYLNTKVTAEGGDKNFQVIISNLEQDKLSLGTYLGFGFFCLTHETEKDSIIIWDEPENSMHSTRRRKICELMKEDERSFVIATHATEFVPLQDKKSTIYKTLSNLNGSITSCPECSIHETKNLSDYFSVCHCLGMEPSKVLFTSNCIVWVEGPTDLIYYRYWIDKYCKENKKELVEGFDYSFCYSGGSLLAGIGFCEDLPYEDWDKNQKKHYEDALVNALQLSQASIFISDSDFNNNTPIDIKSAHISRSDPSCISDQEKTHLKPRVQKILEQTKRHTDSYLFTTYGKEVENFIKPEDMKNIIQGILHPKKPNDKVTADLIDQQIKGITIDEWTPILSEFDKKFIDEDNVVGRSSLKKPDFAKRYIQHCEGNSFKTSKLADNGRMVGEIVNKIEAIKGKYNQ